MESSKIILTFQSFSFRFWIKLLEHQEIKETLIVNREILR